VGYEAMVDHLRPYRNPYLCSMAASELLEHGASPSVVQRQMRHSDSRITSQKYSHVIGDAQRRAVDSLAGRVLGA
jgi:site-specific recombinase XerD